MAYFEMGEIESAQQSLQYYADYIQETYLDIDGLVERLDMLDPSPENYWSKTLPDIKKRIIELPFNVEEKCWKEKNMKMTKNVEIRNVKEICRKTININM